MQLAPVASVTPLLTCWSTRSPSTPLRTHEQRSLRRVIICLSQFSRSGGMKTCSWRTDVKGKSRPPHHALLPSTGGRTLRRPCSADLAGSRSEKRGVGYYGLNRTCLIFSLHDETLTDCEYAHFSGNAWSVALRVLKRLRSQRVKPDIRYSESGDFGEIRVGGGGGSNRMAIQIEAEIASNARLISVGC
jgi:hypothetical protein